MEKTSPRYEIWRDISETSPRYSWSSPLKYPRNSPGNSPNDSPLKQGQSEDDFAPLFSVERCKNVVNTKLFRGDGRRAQDETDEILRTMPNDSKSHANALRNMQAKAYKEMSGMVEERLREVKRKENDTRFAALERGLAIDDVETDASGWAETKSGCDAKKLKASDAKRLRSICYGATWAAVALLLFFMFALYEDVSPFLELRVVMRPDSILNPIFTRRPEPALINGSRAHTKGKSHRG
mmetsp:Transcript_33805/g.56765  ORF Transcript_33805/g.56765 Transcript_33805/m.56765 type:complete len:239 (+) Transcript_33805:360-1076(+)|eukprot:CAMPEP_0198201696 /NCGR_PEP_ID=MMETSP1445-20131203/4669_1 /TAXON_ID=36898 /ORGANISM="Pyramimonas sp., Strain CCMP2087" /LENGTH=238 /DNA_ID=CAMNT_0043872235 /DNA_START=270 /DNA_END=986 /DNA_ORIENTATION=+